LGIKLVSAIIPHNTSNNPADYDPVTLEPKDPESILKRLGNFVFKKDVVLAGERNDRINILLMGMGGAGHDGPYLTDTMIIASVRPSTGEIAMVSIPRDLGVRIPGHGWYKINHASAFGEADRQNWGGAFATEVVEDTFNIDIHYYVRVDFSAFEDIIDEMGGVTINIQRSFTDTEFPDSGFGYQVLTFQKGVETMNGERALQYARSRHGNNGEGSDFARAARQQQVLLAMKEKALRFETLANPVRINNIIGTLDNHITTNMEFSDIIAMLKIARTIDTTKITTLVLDSSPEGFLVNGSSPSGAFILSPSTGDFDAINATIANIFEYEPAKVVNTTPEQTPPSYTPAGVEIQNGTWNAGLAARTKARLEQIDLTVASIGNTNERPQSKSAIINLTEADFIDVMQGLQTELSIPIKKTLPAGITPGSGTDILVILGDDFKEI
jgi:LCP family protein required for cell wall assembly